MTLNEQNIITYNMISLSAEFVRIALGILRTYHKRDNVLDVQVTMSFGKSLGIGKPHLTVKLLSTVSGLQLSAAALRRSTAAVLPPAFGASRQREAEVESLNTADALAFLTFVEGQTVNDRLFNVLLRIEAFPNRPPLEGGLMRQLIMALHPYKHRWTVDTVLPPPSLSEMLIAKEPSTKPSVMWMNRVITDTLFDAGTAKRLANEFDTWMGLGLGLGLYSKDDIWHEFIHVDDDLISVVLSRHGMPGVSILVQGRIINVEGDDWKRWELLPQQP